MSCNVKKETPRGASASSVLGHIGDNCVVKDMPCLMPKENMDMFTKMQKQAGSSSFGNYPNPYNIWHPNK